jgi:hypothetical protein
LHVLQERLQCQSPGQAIHLVGNIRGGPVDRLLKVFYGLNRQLELAMSGLAVLQLRNVLLIQGEALKVGKLRRIAETLDCEIA